MPTTKELFRHKQKSGSWCDTKNKIDFRFRCLLVFRLPPCCSGLSLGSVPFWRIPSWQRWYYRYPPRPSSDSCPEPSSSSSPLRRSRPRTRDNLPVARRRSASVATAVRKTVTVVFPILADDLESAMGSRGLGQMNTEEVSEFLAAAGSSQLGGFAAIRFGVDAITSGIVFPPSNHKGDRHRRCRKQSSVEGEVAVPGGQADLLVVFRSEPLLLQNQRLLATRLVGERAMESREGRPSLRSMGTAPKFIRRWCLGGGRSLRNC